METGVTQAKISCLVMCYEKITGMKMCPRGLVNPYERTLYDIVQAGYTVKDLELVLVWLKKRIHAGVRNAECKKPMNLFRDVYTFSAEVELARAESRNEPPAITPLQRVIEQAQARPPEKPKKDAKPIGYWIEQMRRAADGGKDLPDKPQP